MVYRRSARANQMAQNFFHNLELLSFSTNDIEMSDNHYLPRNDDIHVGAQNAGLGNVYRAGGNMNSSVDQGVLYLAEQIGSLYENPECSDVILLVEDKEISAHKVILAARSSYFRAMFFGGMRETTERTVKLEETPVQAFRLLLRYIYTGRIQLHAIQFDLVVDVLGLVHKYGFNELEHNIAEYLKSILSARNVCVIYTSAIMYSMRGLASVCLDFIDSYAQEIIQTTGFLQLSASALAELIGRNSFCAPEIEIFKAVLRWMDGHPEEVEYFPSIISHIRLSLIKLDDLLNVVRPSGFIQPDVLLDAINDQTKKKSSDLIYRGFLLPNANVASAAPHQARVISGDNVHSLLTGESHLYDNQDRNYTRHTINDKDPGIIVELNKPYIINHIKLHLLDRDQRAYMYFIEVSMDQHDWVRVVDHSHYLCRSKQNLYFLERVVKYIRVKATHSSLSSTFYLQSLEAMYTTEPFEIDTITTLLIPQHNVATIPNNALVIEGVSRSRNALLNGDTKNYDWDNGYTCHQLGSGSITVQLPQPYLIDSMRLLLWDCDDRHYSYYIQVGVDNDDWNTKPKVCERSQAKGWQLIRFERQPVVFIKIVGTYNSANEVFHCVHFECPAQVDDIQEGPSTSSMLRQANGMLDENPVPSTSRAQMVQPFEDGIEDEEERDDVQARLDLLDVRDDSVEVDRDLEQGLDEQI